MGIHKNGMEWKNRENLGAFSGQTSKKCRLRFKRRALQIVILFLGLYPRLPMRHCAISSKGVFENDSETNPLSILLPITGNSVCLSPPLTRKNNNGQ